MGWVETPAPERAKCVLCDAEAVAVFVSRHQPAVGRPLCVDHVIAVLKRQITPMEIHEVRY